MSIGGFSLASQLKQTAAEWAPSLWVRWRLMHRAHSAEIELSLLKNIVGATDITVDVGANLGLYTRTLAALSAKVHAFEPSNAMAEVLRRTSARNVVVHETALSDRDGYAELRTPTDGARLTHSLGSLEADAVAGREITISTVELRRLDSVVHERVAFVKIDVEGHELNVLRGSTKLIERCRPVCLVEAENRHRPDATASVFEFFRNMDYEGFFLRDGEVCDTETFDPDIDQDRRILQSDGGRLNGRPYINNFFFMPAGRNGRDLLSPS